MNAPSTLLHQKAVLPIAIAAFLVPVLIIEYPILQFTHGEFAYPIDDACIHLSIAKNLALHGVWGTYSGQFASAASSILYPLLLALFVKVLGVHLWIPFFVNVIAVLVLLVVLERWLVRQGLGPVAQVLVLCGVIFLTPLAPLAISGMEHVLQFLFTFLFVTRLAEDLEKLNLSAGEKWRPSPAVYLYGALMASTRYEGMVILGIGALLLLINKKIWVAILLFICGVIPVILFGIYSIRHGNFFLPNSVLLKSGAPPLTFDGLYEFFTQGLFYKLFYSVVGYNTIATQRALLLLLLSFLVFKAGLRDRPAYKYILLLLTAAMFIHLSFTGYARFPRYEAYLIGCTVAVVGMLSAKYWNVFFTRKESIVGNSGLSLVKAGLTSWITALTILFLAFPLVLRSTAAFDQIDEGSYETYKVLYTAGDFLHRYYNKDAVSLECLGAMSYFSDGKKMDVVGLGDIDVARRLREHRYTIDFLDSLSKQENVQIAAGTPISTPPALLKRWTKVATWYVPPSEGGYYISFYAVNLARTAELKRNLIEYQKFLPEGEKAIYY
jgi:hypothetical protein